MNPADPNKSLAETFAENERKIRRITIASFCIFLLLTISTAFFGISSYHAKKKAEAAELKLKISDSLAKETVSAFYQQIAELENLNRTLENANRAVSNKSIKIHPADVHEPDSSLRKFPKKDLIYLQYTESYSGTVDSVLNTLRSAGYNPLGKEKMRRSTFNSSVKYFNAADIGKAEKIAILINTRIGRYKQSPIYPNKQNLSAPAGQIEIWLGKSQQLNATQIITNESKSY